MQALSCMTQVLDSLLQLQAFELGIQSPTNTAIEELRKSIPAQFLQHYDRLRARGKKGVAMVRHGVCSQCHMQVAVGLLASLRHEDALYRCQTCGAFLCLAPEPPPVMEMPPRAVKPGRRGRPRKNPIHAA